MNPNDYFFTVTVDGQDHTAVLTNGALIRFAEITGHDFGESPEGASKVRDNVAIIYAALEAGARRNGASLPWTMMEFADLTSPADLASFAGAMQRISSGSDDSKGSNRSKKKPSA